MMKAVIIDDEPHCRTVIERILANHCPQVTVVGTGANGVEGLKAILKYEPDLVFLDIEMTPMNGFQMLDALGPDDVPFALIFTTAYDKFAVQAFRYSAFEYLLKPIDDEELVATIQRLSRKITPSQQLLQLRQSLSAQGDFNKLTIAHTRGLTFLEIDKIIALEADSNYTRIYVDGGETVLASKTLGYFDELLTDRPSFFRTHKQFMVNLHFIKEYISGNYHEIRLQNGLIAKLARTRREAFLAIFRT